MRKDSQDVGLEAAIIERVRKSSLVECPGADNVPRLKHRTEAVDGWSRLSSGRGDDHGRGALCAAEKLDRENGWSAHK